MENEQSVALPKFARISPLVWRILGGNPGKFQLQGTNTYLIGNGRERLLIDTGQGFPEWIDSLKKVLLQEKAVVKKAVITHYHHDHVGGILDLKKLCPDVEIFKNQPGTDPTLKNIQDGDEFLSEGATLKAIFTPGHTHDHMCFILKEEHAVFTGDNVLGHGTTIFENLKQYMDSLKIMLDLKPNRAYPGHGQVVEDSVAKLNEYILHREKREMQIFNHLQMGKAEGEGAVTSMTLVKRIYTDLSAELLLAAERGTIQVLEKLEKDGMVESMVEGHDRKWCLKDCPSL